MAHEVDDGLARTIVGLQPWVQTRPKAEQFPRALQALVQAEEERRGAREPVSGAFHQTFLTQGSLLKREFDLSIHAHTGFPLEALICDVRGMIHVNQRYGFPTGDAFLRTVVEALEAACPTASVVRIHTDAFAALLPPGADAHLSPALEAHARSMLAQRQEAFFARLAGAPLTAEFTLSQLSLLVRDPSHWQVLGPLVWAECERAHALARAGKATGVQRRELQLHGGVERT